MFFHMSHYWNEALSQCGKPSKSAESIDNLTQAAWKNSQADVELEWLIVIGLSWIGSWNICMQTAMIWHIKHRQAKGIQAYSRQLDKESFHEEAAGMIWALNHRCTEVSEIMHKYSVWQKLQKVPGFAGFQALRGWPQLVHVEKSKAIAWATILTIPPNQDTPPSYRSVSPPAL